MYALACIYISICMFVCMSCLLIAIAYCLLSVVVVVFKSLLQSYEYLQIVKQAKRLLLGECKREKENKEFLIHHV